MKISAKVDDIFLRDSSLRLLPILKLEALGIYIQILSNVSIQKGIEYLGL